MAEEPNKNPEKVEKQEQKSDPVPEVQKSAPMETISLEDLDSLGNEEEPKSGDTQEGIETETDSDSKKVESYGFIKTQWIMIREKVEKGAEWIADQVLSFIYGTIDFCKTVKTKFPIWSKQVSEKVLIYVKVIVSWFKQLNPKKAGILLGALVLSGVGVKVIVSVGGLIKPSEPYLLGNFESVADEIFDIDDSESFEDFTSPLRHPDYTVLIRRLAVNLKRKHQDENPMAIVEIFLDATSKDTATELKVREREVRELFRDVASKISSDELLNPEGKQKLKVFFKKSVNALLQTGKVKRVYFKTVVIKKS